MLRNYIAAAFGNLSRNWLYAGITILGLSVSFAAAILIGLYLRDETSFDRFIPGYQQVYRIEEDLSLPGEKPFQADYVAGTTAANLALDFPGVERTARLEVGGVGVRRGDLESLEQIGWADPSFFKVMPFEVLAGDLNAALEAPDGLVLSREMARKYFGEDAPIGKTLKLSMALNLTGLSPDEALRMSGQHVMRVLAVLKGLPASSHMTLGVFGSGRAELSMLAMDDRHPSPYNQTTLSYIRLKPGASPDAIRAGLPAFANRRYPTPNGGASALTIHLEPLKDLHFVAHQAGDGMRPPGDRAVDAGIGAVGLLIIAIAAINFVTLMTARATRRAVEVGVRKAVGATRRDLIVQFMGEALIYVLMGVLIGLSLAELMLPYANAFLGREIRFDYLGDPLVLASILGAALLTAGVAGAYPAVIISGFRPALALKGGSGVGSGSASVRQLLVVAQFAILIGLIVMTATIYRQTDFALNKALRLDSDQMFRIAAPCETGLKQEIAALPGVDGVACASRNVVTGSESKTFASQPGHTQVGINIGPVDVGFFEMHGLKALAGRFFDSNRGQDVVLQQSGEGAANQPTVVLNQTAAYRLGFKTPQDAVGKTISWGRWSASTGGANFPPFAGSEVIGIVPDFTLKSIRDRIDPVIYYVDPGAAQFMVVKLNGHQIPETLRDINRVWRATGHDRPLPQEFEAQAVQDLYKDVITQGIAIGICSGSAILIACVGLFALAAFTTERRTKEIGVRKAMGASTFDIVRLLLWQFTKPVLWANLIAWPLAFWAMDHWLQGFAYRVDLPPWLFVAASAAAVLIAWSTVSVHAWMVARAKPSAALRYE
ncbi:MAG TPA: ABC transporter permease [Caulobacteraceae bacterium]